MTEKVKRILCVCTGNICRSPMAEYLLRERLGKTSGIEVASAGVAAWAGSPASIEAVEALKDFHIDLTPHASQPMTPELVDSVDLIVVMTSAHSAEIARRFPAAVDKVALLTSFGTSGEPGGIADPIGCSVAVYRQCRDEIDSAISDLILYLRENGSLTETSRERVSTMKIAVGADHGGYELKEKLKTVLEEKGIEVEDVGAFSTESVDYPDSAAKVAHLVSEGEVDQGLLVCTTGVGMSITANKFPRVRAALCFTPKMGQLARSHNNANVLALGSAITEMDEAVAILEEWLKADDFEVGSRHDRRVGKITDCMATNVDPVAVYNGDPEIYSALRSETKRQRENLELIASENYASRAVREASGSIMTNKYAEGYPGKRWYHGCEFVDEAERLAIDRAKELFGADHANVQPHSGSGANMAVYFAMLEPGDTILAMSLAEGGHLTHGHPMNFSGRLFNVVPYGVDKETETISYDEVQRLAEEHKPKMIVAGASAYSRIIDFKRLRQIADSVGAYLMVDMAHIAGLVAAGCHPNPVPYCEFVTTTTHKTLRGPRGGMVLCQERFAADINRQVFPGIQGGPLMHIVAAKAVCFYEALKPSFKEYQQQVVRNAQALAASLQTKGLRIVSDGTDNHLMLVDLTSIDVTGKDAAAALDKACITVNKNAIPFDTKSPFVTSGVRLGTPAVTTRGMGEEDMGTVAELIRMVLDNPSSDKVLKDVREQVVALTANYPVP